MSNPDARTATQTSPSQRGVTQAGTYTISAWWSQGSNRSATAPYILPNGNVVNNATIVLLARLRQNVGRVTTRS